MAYLAAFCGLLACCAAGAVWIAVARTREAERLAMALEHARDRLFEAEDRAERLRSEGERALDEAETRAEAGARAKARFLASVTHEMRTPLSGVVGAVDLLLDGRLAPDQRTYARAILSSAEAMLALVDEILDLSRIEAEPQPPAETPFAPAAVVEEVAELLAPRARAKGLDLAVLVDPRAPEEIVGDPARVRQILLNLAGNAVKFTEAGGVGVRLACCEGELRFVVEDTGPGFDPVETERLFQEFEQGDHGPAAGGAGLGLAISRRLASAMGGSLSGFAAPGQGATFTLTLPCRSAPAPTSAAPLLGRRIAVLSCAPFTGPWLAEGLRSLGAEAVAIDPRPTSWRTLLAGSDTVVVDRDGGGAPSDLAAAARLAGASHVLLALHPADRGDLDRLSAQGFDGYLVKPARAGSLASRILDPRAADDGASEPAGDGSATAFPAAGGLKVLVAEDDPVSALIALAHLARLGHASVHVADGEAAADVFASEPFDVALIDLRMPRLDGCAAARRMRDAEAAGGRAPALILALTANAGEEDAAAAIAAGMDGLMAKPLDRRALEVALAPLTPAAVSAA